MNLQKRIIAAALAAGMSVTVFGMTTFAAVSINRGSISMNEGDTYYLEGDVDVDINGKDFDESDVSWSTSSSRVAYVDRDGYLHAEDSGTATITASISGYGGDTIYVTVRDYRDDWDDDDWDDYYNDRYDRGDDYYDPYLDEWVYGYRRGDRYYDEYGIDRRRDDYELVRRELLGERAASRPTTSRNTTSNLLTEIKFDRNPNLTKTADQATVVNAAARSGSARLDNYASVSVDTLHAAASRSSGVINFDTRSGGNLVGRLQITPSKAESLTSGSVQLGVHYMDSKTKTLSERFNDTYASPVHVVMCDQGNYGMSVRIYVLLDANADAEDLMFYTYNASSNSISKLDVTGVSIDANGYVSFNTNYGGTILISEDGALR